ncbi:MAG: phosphoenolpyruvate--protein phosphotransferase, partial [Clostridiales bacterium]|nr:phosphoenolpyruvate--protein phosphotransferase [Clostridiales bacterium]
AFVTEKGSPASHTAILARSMNIPAIIGVHLSPELDGRDAAVDGYTGLVYIDPDEKTLKMLREKKRGKDEQRELLKELKDKPTVTVDGKTVKLYANIGTPADLGSVIVNDAEGIGLLRSEFLYLESNDFPSEEVQFEAYKKVCRGMGEKPVIIRTLDIGADKKIDYFGLEDEENPALGMRAIRICLTRRDIFKTQLRAILHASAFGNIMIMLPMIVSVKEITEAKKVFEEAKAELSAEGIPFAKNIPVGIMIETPAAVMISDKLAEHADFFSIGTNDLTQYTLAMDRQNGSIAEFMDIHHEAVLRMIELVVKNSHEKGIWTGICGELGADLELIPEFVKMGVDELSVSPGRVLEVRKTIRECCAYD